MKSLYRYQKLHFKKITVKKELYEELRALASKENITIPQFIEKLIEHYKGNNKGNYIGYNNANTKKETPMVNRTLFTYTKDKA